MPLPQTLKLNERGTALYDGKGKFLGYEDIIIPSDEQLQAEANDARLKEIANMPDAALKVPLLAESIKLLIKKLGFD